MEFTRSPAQSVRAAFGPQQPGSTLGATLDALDSSDAVLFDSVEQVRLDTWHKGRVVLVGDSAWCVTLYAGMGVSSGLAGADLLGTMVERHPDDLDTALTGWERGVLTDDPRSTRLLDPLGLDAVMHRILPIWRAHDLARTDWPLTDQAFALRALIAGFTVTSTGRRHETTVVNTRPAPVHRGWAAVVRASPRQSQHVMTPAHHTPS
jgi:hypothetical protein